MLFNLISTKWTDVCNFPQACCVWMAIVDLISLVNDLLNTCVVVQYHKLINTTAFIHIIIYNPQVYVSFIL